MTACLNESPSKKEGKCGKALRLLVCPACRLNESPSKKEGKSGMIGGSSAFEDAASMKAPPRRKGNLLTAGGYRACARCLNESPSKKEGKSPSSTRHLSHTSPQ